MLVVPLDPVALGVALEVLLELLLLTPVPLLEPTGEEDPPPQAVKEKARATEINVIGRIDIVVPIRMSCRNGTHLGASLRAR